MMHGCKAVRLETRKWTHVAMLACVRMCNVCAVCSVCVCVYVCICVTVCECECERIDGWGIGGMG